MGWFHAAFADGTFDPAEHGFAANECALPPKKIKQAPPCPKDLTGVEVVYHMCLRKHWEEAVRDQTAYFSPTFHADGRFTRASVYKDTLLDTANQFYKVSSPPSEDWICLEINLKLLLNLGVVVLPQAETSASDATSGEEKKDNATPPTTDVQCLQIHGGITTLVPGLIHKVYSMKRRACGTFLAMLEGEPQQSIPGIGLVTPPSKQQLSAAAAAKRSSKIKAIKTESSSSSAAPPERAKNNSKSKSTGMGTFFGMK